MSIDKDAETPPYLQLVSILRSKIESGELRLGARLPALTDLMHEYDLSRNTVRRAIAALADEGLVRTRPGWGTFVAPADDR